MTPVKYTATLIIVESLISCNITLLSTVYRNDSLYCISSN